MKQTDLGTLRWAGAVAGRAKLRVALLAALQAVLGASGVCSALLLRGVVDSAAAGDRRGFFVAVALIAALAAAQIALRTASRLAEESARSLLYNRFSGRLFSHLLRADCAASAAVHSGEWMNRLTSDAAVVADGVTQILPGAAGMAVRLGGALGALLVLEPRFAWLVVPGGAALLVLSWVFRPRLKRLHRSVQEADGRSRAFLQESLGSLLVVRAFVREAQVERGAQTRMDSHRAARMRRAGFSAVCSAGFSVVMNAMYLLGAGMCGYGILTGTMTYGTLMAVLQLIAQAQAPLAGITGYLPRYYAALASAERLREAEALAAPAPHMKSAVEVRAFYRDEFCAVRLAGVDFTYRAPASAPGGQEQPAALRGLDLCVRKGECVAFTGPSGCGKSTALKLLLCLYEPDAGRRELLCAGGTVPLDESYRRLFAYVPQGNHLMSGTIREIVAFSDAEGMRDEAGILRALDIACASEFVRALPAGIDTELGERGAGLSEGQMQRIAIARAVFADAPILALDESTSALDADTERRVLANLRAMTDRTVLIVTHRPAALDICDRHIAFSGGAETGEVLS